VLCYIYNRQLATGTSPLALDALPYGKGGGGEPPASNARRTYHSISRHGVHAR